MTTQRKIVTLQVEVQFDGDAADASTIASDLAWSLLDQFGVDNEWNAGRDDKLVVLATTEVTR